MYMYRRYNVKENLRVLYYELSYVASNLILNSGLSNMLTIGLLNQIPDLLQLVLARYIITVQPLYNDHLGNSYLYM